jgi:hypothetical protein
MFIEHGNGAVERGVAERMAGRRLAAEVQKHTWYQDGNFELLAVGDTRKSEFTVVVAHFNV